MSHNSSSRAAKRVVNPGRHVLGDDDGRAVDRHGRRARRGWPRPRRSKRRWRSAHPAAPPPSRSLVGAAGFGASTAAHIRARPPRAPSRAGWHRTPRARRPDRARAWRRSRPRPVRAPAASRSRPWWSASRPSPPAVGCSRISLSRKASPFMLGISMSSVTTSGSSVLILSRASIGSTAVPTTVMSPSRPSVRVSTSRITRGIIDDQNLDAHAASLARSERARLVDGLADETEAVAARTQILGMADIEKAARRQDACPAGRTLRPASACRNRSRRCGRRWRRTAPSSARAPSG